MLTLILLSNSNFTLCSFNIFIFINNRYGAFIGHTCNLDESKLEDLQLRYAQFVDILQDEVHGMEDAQSDSGLKKK